LPGPLAVTLSNKTLKVVENNDYWVCEKSDGERAMFLMIHTPERYVDYIAAIAVNESLLTEA
jgi:hypothetical protein